MAEIVQVMDSRRAFIETLCGLAAKDKKIVLIIADVGFNYVEKFSALYPERFFNFGITEQAAIIIATTLALAGFKPYVYSMVNFIVFRPYEMVRNAICMHNANVKLIGVKGTQYRFYGFSHNLLRDNEDIDALRKLPNMKTYTAENPKEVRAVLLESYKRKGPTYVRI
jgi:transketolase